VLLAPSLAGAQSSAPHSIGLLWTATGDDADVGQAYRYDMRFSSSPVGTDTLTWWINARSATNLPAPSLAGQSDSAVVTGLNPETTYNFILRVVDEIGNVSPFSDVASATTGTELPPPPPGCTVASTAPSSFDAHSDSTAILVSWGGTSDSAAVSLHLWRATGSSGALSLLATITDLSKFEYVDASVTAGDMYRYRATWASPCGDGPPTASVVVSMPAPPSPPSPPPSAPGARIHAYPNPSQGNVQFVIHVTATSGQHVQIRLFDLTGRLVADIADGSYPPGDTTISWGRTTRNGNRIAPGYYEAIGHVGEARVRDRIVLLP